ncbi:hypothetical protein V499_02286 [Pseudogymnoascus sp. VKM F-103]|nr:hypothetical protein V499_02286 [Pseudogymnoascus sp. VKM F-103]
MVGITIIRTAGLAPKRPKRQPDAGSLDRFAIVCNRDSSTRNCWGTTLITMSQCTESNDSNMSSPSRSELPPLRTTARDLARLFRHLTPLEDVDDKGIITKCITQLKSTVDDHEDRVRLLEHQPYAGSPNEPATDVPTASSFERLQQEVKGLDEVVNERDIRVSEAEEDIRNIKAEVEEFQDFIENGNIVTDEHLREILPTLVTKTDLKTDLEELRLTTKADLKTGLKELRLANKTNLEGLRLEIRASQNYRASRFINENLHNQEHASELVRCLEFYLSINNWPFKALDEADDFNYFNIDLLGPLLHTVPKSWEEAVKLSPRRSVYVLFRALGLRTHRLDRLPSLSRPEIFSHRQTDGLWLRVDAQEGNYDENAAESGMRKWGLSTTTRTPNRRPSTMLIPFAPEQTGQHFVPNSKRLD